MGKSWHFMVVLFGDFSQRLKIPQNFVKHIEKDFGKLHMGPLPVKLAGPTGRTWRMFIERTGSKTCFTRGWSNFAKDHVLKENEFLVFHYDGTEQFSTVIVDETMCERKNMMRKESAKQAPKAISLSDSESSGSSESDEEYDEEVDQEEEDDSDNCSAYSYAANTHKKRGVPSSPPSPPHRSTTKKMRSQYVSRRRAVTDLEKMKAFEAAFSFTSNKPYCRIEMTANMVYCWTALRFPMKFSMKHLPKKPTKFVLKNCAGEEWIGSYFLEGKHSLKGLISRGWSKFARDNNIEAHDQCVFELVKKNVLHIHIFRVVEQVVSPVWITRAKK